MCNAGDGPLCVQRSISHEWELKTAVLLYKLYPKKVFCMLSSVMFAGNLFTSIFCEEDPFENINRNIFIYQMSVVIRTAELENLHFTQNNHLISLIILNILLIPYKSTVPSGSCARYDCCLMMSRHANTERSHQAAPCAMPVMGLHAFSVRFLTSENWKRQDCCITSTQRNVFDIISSNVCGQFVYVSEFCEVDPVENINRNIFI